MHPLYKFFSFILAGAFGIFSLGIIILGAAYIILAPQLPSIDSLREVRLQVPLRVYSRSDQLIGEFGEMRRIPVKISEVPKQLIQAVLAAEDDRFYTHPGVDYQGLMRASLHLLTTGEKRQGGSTITMQVARNFFLNSEKTYSRKLKEILLALKIESELDKNSILELYLNKIYLGNRAYGVAAAAQLYYGVTLDKLTVAQMAMLAGLPKAPSRFNPVVNLVRATQRRNYVLERMNDLEYLDDAAYKAALASPETARRHSLQIEVEAPYVAEMVRSEMVRRYGEEAYTGGYRVVTTVDAQLQHTANAALRVALIEYDMRHGYRKPVRHVEVPVSAGPTQWNKLLAGASVTGNILPALVIKVEEQSARLYSPSVGLVEVPWAGLSWARTYIDENKRGPVPKTAGDILAVGDIVGLLPLPEGQWQLAQVPTVQGAMVSLTPNTGAVTSLVGGFYFYESSFNRVTQADRQPGSSFKPFLYSAALDRGFTPASVINDAPIVVENANFGDAWRPENYGRKFNGPTTLRNALAHSRNLVSIRVLRAIGIKYAINYITRFGFPRARLPRGLSLALGSSVSTPMELAQGYLVFANGGYRIEPYFIERIEGPDGVLMQAEPPVLETLTANAPTALTAEEQLQADIRNEEGVADEPIADEAIASESTGSVVAAAAISAGKSAQRVITAQNAYLMTSMMRDVIRKGTARRAMALNRNDLAGKTGTTNEQRDAWFAGFNSDIVAVSWVGFDKHNPLGNLETGGHAALPMWMRFMEVALKDLPEKLLAPPSGILTENMDPDSGQLVSGTVPQLDADQSGGESDMPPPGANSPVGTGVPEQLF
ncbi:MAG: penicillin-binding protein 1A [Gammaproteobacteria bacterium]